MLQPLIIEKTVKDADGHGVLLNTFLRRKLGMSRSLVKSIKFNGLVLVNDTPRNVRYRLTAGDRVTVHLPPERPSETLYRTPMPLDILYEDEHYLIVNKPANLPVTPSFQYTHHTLANGVFDYLNQKGYAYTVHTVTRLDKDTSGAVVIAKHRFAHERLTRLQKDNQLTRNYMALASGQLENREGVIDAPIGRKEGSIIERRVREDGKRAVTHYEVIQQMKQAALVAVRLETGRTHQIRVHFSHLGHPLLGDDLYGGSRALMKRQALHCQSVQFPHPLEDQIVEVTVNPPADFESLVSQLTHD